jgi:hypothetical protein
VKLTTHLHLVPRSKNAWSHTSTPPIRLHGAVLSETQGQLYLLRVLSSLPISATLVQLLFQQHLIARYSYRFRLLMLLNFASVQMFSTFAVQEISFPLREQTVSMAERSKASTVFGRSNIGIAGSNPTRGMDVCVCVSVLCRPV